MANDNDNSKNTVNHLVENLESIGQVVLGEIEKIGGILTADSNAQAEGDFNLSNGILHHEANRNLQKAEETE